ncbi:MAG: type II toxin-antitoxin system VapC family toxin [candidate division Zixibacteria bacterium]|nr:type II toxin-antitoxin system VapC family toxin [candidate division Zixibacteria bacterium]
MPTKVPLVYLDSCIFIAWLKNEQRKNSEETKGVKEVMHLIDNNKVRMITSALTRAEVLQCTLSTGTQRDFDNVLRRRNVMVANTDHHTWALTHDLRDHYQNIKVQENLPTLSVPDAIHLATAIQYEVDTFYTFDENDKPGKSRALIPLDGNVAGYDLKVKKPLGDPDLFTGLEQNAEATDDDD